MRTQTPKHVALAFALLVPSTLAAQGKDHAHETKPRVAEARGKVDAARKEAEASIQAAQAQVDAAREKMKQAAEQAKAGSSDAAKALREEARKAMKESMAALHEAREQARDNAKAHMEAAREEARAAMDQAHQDVTRTREQAHQAMQGAHEQMRNKIDDAHHAMRSAIGAGDRGARTKHSRRKLFMSMREQVQRPEDVPSDVRAELGKHARRMARLSRAREVAIEVKDDASQQRAQRLLAQEMMRHRKDLIALWQAHQKARAADQAKPAEAEAAKPAEAEAENEAANEADEKTDENGVKP